VSRAQALECAVTVITRSVGDIAHLVELLDAAGQGRLANALRVRLSAKPVVIGVAKPDKELWARGKL
jgi:hypothetical protein